MDLNNLDLDINNAGTWPLPVKLIAALLLVAAVCGAGYWYDTQQQIQNYERERARENTLKNDFVRRQSTLANIDAFRRQIAELEGMLEELVALLPTSTEMPDLLDQVFERGRRNGLQFQVFRPENDQPREFYIAKPITVRANASFHQFASFVSAVASMDRIVTIESFNITFDAIAALPPPRSPTGRGNPPPRPGTSTFPLIEARLQTYRMDTPNPEEAGGTPARPATPPRPGARR